jgi:hypothetical protein
MNETSYNLTAASRDLLNTYQLWVTQWPATIRNHTRKASDIQWWDRAAEVCVQMGISGAMLVYCCYRYMNARPDDMVMEFQPTVFRSQALMRRSIQNFRDFLRSGAESLEILYMLRNHNNQLVAARSVDEMLRQLATLTVDYFREKINVRSYTFRKNPNAKMTPVLRDTLQFALCGANPFLLMCVAETEKIADMAALNGRVLAAQMPWVKAVWEHVLPDEWAHRPIDPAKYFTGGEAYYCWPLDPWSTPYFAGDRTMQRPRLPLLEGIVDRTTDCYLISLLDQSKKSR